MHEIESWLMADHKSMANFLRVPEGKLPEAPDQINDPKHIIVSLARKSGRSDVRAALVPHPRSGLSSGPEYASWMTQFANEHWDPDAAIESQRSPSLLRAVGRLKELTLL